MPSLARPRVSREGDTGTCRAKILEPEMRRKTLAVVSLQLRRAAMNLLGVSQWSLLPRSLELDM